MNDHAADRDEPFDAPGDAAVEASDAPEADQLRAELDAARDQILRAQADLENYRKRMRREMEDERKYANLPLLRDLLPVLDNMGRAARAAESATDAAGLLAGFKMVEQQLQGVLRQFHGQPIDPAAGDPFDPNLHQAISAVPTDQYPANTVLQVAQTGYQLHDRVIRPAQVIVSTAKTS